MERNVPRRRSRTARDHLSELVSRAWQLATGEDKHGFVAMAHPNPWASKRRRLIGPRSHDVASIVLRTLTNPGSMVSPPRIRPRFRASRRGRPFARCDRRARRHVDRDENQRVPSLVQTPSYTLTSGKR
jgi:hypothetical protein